MYKEVLTVDEEKEVCRDHSVWRSVVSDYPATGIQRETKLIKFKLDFYSNVQIRIIYKDKITGKILLSYMFSMQLQLC